MIIPMIVWRRIAHWFIWLYLSKCRSMRPRESNTIHIFLKWNNSRRGVHIRIVKLSVSMLELSVYMNSLELTVQVTWKFKIVRVDWMINKKMNHQLAGWYQLKLNRLNLPVSTSTTIRKGNNPEMLPKRTNSCNLSIAIFRTEWTEWHYYRATPWRRSIRLIKINKINRNLCSTTLVFADNIIISSAID